MKNNPIFPPHEVFYIESLLSITRRAIQDIYFCNEAIVSNKDSKVAVLDSIQYIILAGASLSRYFWPSPPMARNKEEKISQETLHKNRAKQLREALLIADNSPIRNREIRNTLEHFDAKLDLFLANYPAGTIYPDYIGPKENIDEKITFFFRAYFTDSDEFRVLGVNYAIKPITKEIIRIHDLLVEYNETGRFPRTL